MFKYKVQLVREQEFEYGQVINNSNSLKDFAISLGLDKEPEEVMTMLALDSKNEIIGVHEVSRGTLSNSLVSSAAIFKRALLNNARGIMLIHNHPSGVAKPSLEDFDVTQKISEAARILEIPLIDHLIIGYGEYYSFHEEGYC